MIDIFLNSFAPISFVFELIALALSFYLKNSRIFFITLALLCSRGIYFYASIYQAHLFVSLFLPFVFVLFVVLEKGVLIFEKKSLVRVGVLVFVGFLALFLSKSTNFNSSMSESLFDFNFFAPVSELSFVFLGVELLFLLLWGFLKDELYFAAAFALSFIQFLFQSSLHSSFFEFGSLFFILYLVYHSYKSLYFDTFTKLPNQKAMKRALLGLKGFYIGALRLQGFEGLNAREERNLFKKIGKILRNKGKKVRVFRVDDDFVFIFESLDESLAKEFLSNLKQGFENTSSWLKDKNLKLVATAILFKNKEKFEENLLTIKESLAPEKRG